MKKSELIRKILALILVVIFISSCWNTSSTSSGNNNEDYDTPQQVEDYSDIEQQIKICERAKQKFLKEVNAIFANASLPQYQGFMAQTLFWDANEALDVFNREGEKLERLLREHGFIDEASAHVRDRGYLNQVYREERRKALGY